MRRHNVRGVVYSTRKLESRKCMKLCQLFRSLNQSHTDFRVRCKRIPFEALTREYIFCFCLFVQFNLFVVLVCSFVLPQTNSQATYPMDKVIRSMNNRDLGNAYTISLNRKTKANHDNERDVTLGDSSLYFVIFL